MGGFAGSFRELEVYKAALILAGEIHEFAKRLPKEERYAMSDQIRRASRSVCQNIAEAWRKRRYAAAFVAKLNDAETEAAELQCCLDLCRLHNFLDDEKYLDWDHRYEIVIAQLITMANNADKWCR